jgi:hypothetical protein
MSAKSFKTRNSKALTRNSFASSASRINILGKDDTGTQNSNHCGINMDRFERPEIRTDSKVQAFVCLRAFLQALV